MLAIVRRLAAATVVLSLSASLSLSLGACSDEEPEPETRFGPMATVGAGSARAYVVLDASGQATAVGVRISEEAVAQPPAGMSSVVAALPTGAPIPFDHVTVDWNPGGHPPPGIYDKAHFDLHFYLISEQERALISPADPQFGAKGARQPPAEHVPAGYVATPGAVPMMGAHWTDPASPELNGQAFTITMSHGFYDGKLVFFEPMFTKAYLETKPTLNTSLRLPQSYARAGRYPTAYRLTHDPLTREYVFELRDLRAR